MDGAIDDHLGLLELTLDHHFFSEAFSELRVETWLSNVEVHSLLGRVEVSLTTYLVGEFVFDEAAGLS